MDSSTVHTAYNVPRPESAPKPQTEDSPWGADGFTFFDLLDIVNPLQHIPVVSTLYREFTGDDLAPAARVAGSTLYGGAIGFGVSLANTAIESVTGRDLGGHVMALLGDGPATEVADNATTASVSDWARQELEYRRQASEPMTASLSPPALTAYERAQLLGLGHRG